MYIVYMYVYDIYARKVLVYAHINWNDTLRHGNQRHVAETRSLGAAVSKPHSGLTWASKHPFFLPSATVVQTRFCATPHTWHASRAPEASPSTSTGVYNARFTHKKTVSWPITADLAGGSPLRYPGASANSENTSRRRVADVSISMYMYLFC